MDGSDYTIILTCIFEISHLTARAFSRLCEVRKAGNSKTKKQEMAQAARLNLRMQKELKLLLTDPPPGASLPFLSGDPNSSSSSLSSIDAQIEGPEGTVYSKGIFNIKIQIPERYPFQPPNVCFVTPIYHPNIDNGGRICLDILNLPPKGAWQPSLNISTVLTSIGLLLSEPNPDDGLMCEVSREYKYNRQAFDQKARSMTERYARAGACGNNSGSGNISINLNPSTMEVKGPDMESKDDVIECNVSQKNLHRISRKLSLEFSGPSQRKDGIDKVNMVPNNDLFPSNSESQKEVKKPDMEPRDIVKEYYATNKKSSEISRKLSLQSLGPSQRDNNDRDNVGPNHESSCSNSPSLCVAPFKSLPIPQASNHDGQQPHQDSYRKTGDYSINSSSKKLFGVNRKLSLVFSESSEKGDGDKKDNMLVTRSSYLHSHTHELKPQLDNDGKMGNDFTNMNHKKLHETGQKLSLELSSPSQRGDFNDKENVVPTHKLPCSNSQSVFSTASSHAGKYDEQRLCQDQDGRSVIGGVNVSHKKLCRIGRNLLLESLGPRQRSDTDNSQSSLLNSQSFPVASSKSLSMPRADNVEEKQQPHQDHDGKTYGSLKKQEEASRIAEAVIVLDSEDSEEEGNGPTRSRLSLTRKRLAGKWRAKV
ncbi:hypothetical protein HHK36_025674 [Tetracentron sinense]|uniref:E2 ubiquitin-conjugating enzyme n=1 Tax=Tetracentron sinense TaxID=13715 RepID=A0A834YJ68_TETSI|nr:hypothetical protein HHK36_025674 [Tetracentron sinense]